MKKFMSYSKELVQLEELKHYISLVDDFEIKDLDDWVVKNYALTNSISGVIKNSLVDELQFDANLVTRQQIIKVLNDKPKNELHKIVHKGYKSKIRRALTNG